MDEEDRMLVALARQSRVKPEQQREGDQPRAPPPVVNRPPSSSVRQWVVNRLPDSYLAEAATMPEDALLESLFRSHMDSAIELAALAKRWDEERRQMAAQLEAAHKAVKEAKAETETYEKTLAAFHRKKREAELHLASTEKSLSEVIKTNSVLQDTITAKEAAIAEAQAAAEADKKKAIAEAREQAINEYRNSAELKAKVGRLYNLGYEDCRRAVARKFPGLDVSELDEADEVDDEDAPLRIRRSKASSSRGRPM